MVKNLLIINGLMFLATYVFGERGILDLTQSFALFYPTSVHFRPWQILTHFFMHGSLLHIFMNMFGLYMFGRMLEIRWGGKRFLFFYLVTAFFAALLHFIVIHYQIQAILPNLSQVQIDKVLNEGLELRMQYLQFSDPNMAAFNNLVNMPVVGASGAIFGILGACYVLFPNTMLYLIFPPIPIRLKVAVTLYGLYELYRGVVNVPGDHVAHFAHLGGLVAGILIVKYWNRHYRDRFY